MSDFVFDPAAHMTHYALSVEPAHAVAPGGTVRLVYHARNRGASACAAATVRFHLPPGVGASTDCVVPVPALAPGALHAAVVDVRVAASCEDGTSLTFAATFSPESGESYASNEPRIVVRGRAVLDGPDSGTIVEPAGEPDVVRVTTTLTNSGDAAALDVVLTIPAPAGCVALEQREPPVFAIARIDPGSAVSVTYRARLTTACAAVGVDGVTARSRDGERVAIRPSRAFAPPARCAIRAVAVAREMRRLHVRIDAANDGFGDARDALVTLRWPAGFRCAEGTLNLDGGPVGKPKTRAAAARATYAPNGATLTIRRLPARTPCAIAFDLIAAGAAGEGEIGVEIGAADEIASASGAFTWTAETRIDAAFVDRRPASVAAGTAVACALEITNHGDRARSLVVRGGGACGDVRTVALAAGSVATVELRALVPADAADGAVLPLTAGIFEGGELVAEAATALSAVNRPWLDTRAWLAVVDGGARLRLRHCGATAAHEVTLILADDGGTVHAGTIEPGTVCDLALPGITPERAARGGVLSVRGAEPIVLAPCPLATAGGARLDATLAAPVTAERGAAIPLRLALRCRVAVERLVVRAVPVDGVSIVAASTRVGDEPLPDRAGGPLMSGAGVTLYAVPAGTAVAIEWSAVADVARDGDEPLRFGATIDADGAVLVAEAEPVALAATCAFAPARTALPFYIDGLARTAAHEIAASAPLDAHVPASDATLFSANVPAFEDATGLAEQPCGLEATVFAGAPDSAGAPGSTRPGATSTERLDARGRPAETASDIPASAEIVEEPAALTFSVPLDPARVATMVRLLRGAAMPGFVSHVLSIRALFPDAVDADDADAALVAARDAVRETLDRLYVKMRIPGYDLTGPDCEDVTGRGSLRALLAATHAAQPTARGTGEMRRASVTIDTATARARLDHLDDAPLGDPRAVAALATFLPRRCDHDAELGAALAAYADGVVTVAHAAFTDDAHAWEERLANACDDRLDRLRSALVARLEPACAPAYA